MNEDILGMIFAFAGSMALLGCVTAVVLTALKRAGEEIQATGTFAFADDILTTGWLNDLMRR